MKKIFTLLVLGIILSTQIANAQGKVNYERKWFLGLNLGGTYHSNTEVDVNKMYRGGTGFTFGRSFNYNKGNFLSFDLRARYLIAAYRGLATQNFTLDSNNYNILDLGNDLQQYQTDYGFYKPNFHTWVNDWSLELQINTNLLREKTGWNLFVFGGIGTVRYHTTIDLYDNDVSFQIKPLEQLDEKGIHYLDYETDVVNKRTWMPSFGAGISKQITPNIAFEIMGRMTWTRNNDFDAMPYNLNGTISKLNDRYHYVSAGFKFRLGWGEGNSSVSNNTHYDNNNSTSNNNNSTPCISPTISSISPTNNVTVTNSNILIKAAIKGKSNETTIKLYQNDVLVSDMNYDRINEKASKNIILSEGVNTIKIMVVNPCGTDEKSINIIYIRDVEPCNAPTISSIKPINNSTVSKGSVQISALISGYTNSTSIKIYKENSIKGNMNYNSSTNTASKTLNLTEGNNTIRMVVSNECGTDEKIIHIIYKKDEQPCTPPTISSVNPINNAIVTNNNVQVDAFINGYTNGTSIKLYKNGTLLGDMNYNSSIHKASKTIGISVGLNTLKIVVSNACGTDEKIINITYNRNEVPCTIPTITSVNPINNTTVSTSNLQVSAVINGFTNGTSIKLYKNNVFVGNMVYNSATGVASKSVVLSNGNNNYKIAVSNACGNNQYSFTLIYKDNTPCTSPTIGITSPLNNTTLTTASINIDAIINNYTIGTTVQLYQNNTFVGNMNYNNVTHKASKAVTLVQENNSFKIKVTNVCGNDEKTFNVIYKESNPVPCNKPTALAFSPINTSITQNDANISLKIKTTNITSNTQIEITNNNTIIPFSFNVATQMITININNLNYGLNTIKTTVTNNCGNDKMIYNVTRERCKLPIIKFNSNGTTTNSNYILNATISNLNDANLITLTLNGVSHNFNYNENTGELLSTLILQTGNNTISIRVNKCKEIIKNLNVIYTSPCNAPTINITTVNTSASPTYVFKANITNVTDANNLTVKHNGNVVNSFFTAGNGELKAYLTLSEGENTIQVIANGCETVTKDFVVTYDVPCVTPIITLTSQTSSTSSTYTFTVSVAGDVSQADINVISNGGNTQFGWIDFNKNLHQLTANITLVDGTNTITVTVNGCETVTETFVINYTNNSGHDTPGEEGPNSENNETNENNNSNQPCDMPTINITTANTSASPTYVFKANITNVADANNLTVKHNGNVVNSFFTAGNGELKAYLTLSEGENTIQVIANGCETVTKDFVVTYDVPCVTPIITLTSQTSSTSSTYTFTVSVAGDVSQADINVISNGGNTQFGWIDFNKNLHQLTANITLVDGTNTITVTVNGCETVTETFVINYTNNSGHDTPGEEGPNSENNETNENNNSNKPEIIKVAPSKNTAIVKSSTYLFKAKVNNINSKNEVNIFVNGIKQTNFIYSKSSNQVSIVAKLKKGQNTIRIEATNNNGNDVEDFIITYQNSNTGAKTNTGGSGTKPKTGTGITTKPKTGSTGKKTSGTSSGTNKTNTSGTKNSESKTNRTTTKPKTGSTGTKTSGTSSGSNKNNTSGTKNSESKTKTGSTNTKTSGTTINKGGK